MRHAINHQLLNERKPDPERRAAVVPIFADILTVVRLDNGSCDGQSHAHAFRLAGEKRLETSFNLSSGMPGPRSSTVARQSFRRAKSVY